MPYLTNIDGTAEKIENKLNENCDILVLAINTALEINKNKNTFVPALETLSENKKKLKVQE